jgi:hypothetical protein
VSFSCVLLCSLNKEKVTAEAGVNDYESWASGGGECVTRGSFGWSKTTPARSFATFGPNFLKIVDAGRKRHGTSLPDLRREGCFFSVLLSFCTKGLTVRVNRLDCETAIFFDGVHLLLQR